MANSKKKCTGCKSRFIADNMIKLPAGFFHSIDCAKDYAQAKSAKARAKQLAKVKRETKVKEKADRAKHKADKERVKKRAEWLDNLQSLVNQFVVHVRDKNEPCFTCGKSNNVKYDAGHYRSRGACKELRFELTNIHKQCSVNCNQWGSGMRSEYREAIIKKYGEDHLIWLDGPHTKLKDQFPHYTDIKAEIQRYRTLLRSKGLKPNY